METGKYVLAVDGGPPSYAHTFIKPHPVPVVTVVSKAEPAAGRMQISLRDFDEKLHVKVEDSFGGTSHKKSGRIRLDKKVGYGTQKRRELLTMTTTELKKLPEWADAGSLDITKKEEIVDAILAARDV